MVYLVTNQTQLFELPDITIITHEESLKIMSDWKIIQVDTETTGRDSHLCDLLCIQFGNIDGDIQIVVDTQTISVKVYKNILEERFLIFQNGKFDIPFLFNYGIIPRKVYDTMIIEQLLHLGWPSGEITYSLQDIALRRLGIYLDKSVRGEIIWRGLDSAVIKYASLDVKYLYQIMQSQLQDLRKQGLLKAAEIECNFVPVIAYLEWCGIYLNEKKWLAKMDDDKKYLEESKKKLDDFLINNPLLSKFTYVNNQIDLFDGFDGTPKCTINWSSPQQVIKVAKELGFNTSVQDKKTGDDKDSVLEKHLKSQKGICDEFLKLYFDYQGYFKVVSSFGQGHLNAINPKTGRVHTIFKQLGCASGRMSCGSQQPNTDLAKVKKLKPSDCTYVNLQQLPADDKTRGAFTNQYDNTLICSADFSALESRLGADIYQEKSMIKEFLEGSGDMHSLCAYMVYKNEIPRDTPISEIKKLYPDLRKAVKPIEFSQQFGGSEYAIQGSMGCSLEEAQEFKKAYDNGFPGITEFKKKGTKFVQENGYVLMCKYSGHKMYWHDWEKWKERQKKYSHPGFWDEYKALHKGTNDDVAKEVKHHFQAASKWSRMALNGPTQGSGIVILKIAMKKFFDWIVDNNHFDKVKLCALVHDEAVIEFNKDISEAPTKLKECMEEAASLICTSLPIPSIPETGTHWIH